MQTANSNERPADNLCVVCKNDLGKGTMVLNPDMCFDCVLEDHTKGFEPVNMNEWAIKAKKSKRRKRR